MQRFLFTLALGGILLLLGGCGGGASNSPDPAPGGNNSPRITVDTPVRVEGQRESSILPDQLNITSGASDSDLRAVLGRLGYTLLRRDGNQATVRIPGGTTPVAAAAELRKQFEISTAEPVNVISMPTMIFEDSQAVRGTSRMPFDPMYGDAFLSFLFDNGGTPGDTSDDFAGIAEFVGQGMPMNSMGFPGAWDTSMDPTVAAVPVKIAIIDAGFFDYTAPGRVDIDETVIDAANSGSVDAAGVFTAGFAAATYTLNSDGDPATRDFPWRRTGDYIFGMLASTHDDFVPRGQEFNGTADIQADEIWNDGIAGINPNAEYVLIKTGALNGGAWEFTDNHIAESIDHAVASGANIIVLGMFGTAPVGANVQTAITAARNADILVVAPAGDVMSTWDGTSSFNGDPVDITATPVTPASAVGCVSVAAGGFGKVGLLPDVDPGTGPIPNNGQGWLPKFDPQFALLDTVYSAVAPFSNYGATIGAHCFGLGLGFVPYLVQGDGTVGNEVRGIDGVEYNTSLNRWSSAHSAAYVAGAASMVYQALAVANGGVLPADVDTTCENILLSTAEFQGMGRLDKTLTFTANALANNGGYLNINRAMNQAISGGTLYQDPMFFTLININQPLTAITQNTAVQLTATIQNGVAPYTLTVDWGDGDGPQITDPWVPGTIETLAGGYTTLGAKALTISVTDADGQTIEAGASLFVINPLTASIFVADQDGGQVALNSLDLATNYVFELRASNLYTGTYDDDDNPATAEVPNTTTFQWDFDSSGGAPDATGTAPVFAYTSPGNYTITVTAQEAFRPDQTITINVTVQ